MLSERLDPVSRTARWTAAARARESERPDRLFDDPLATVLAGEAGRELLTRFEALSGGNPTLALRTRFFDDVLTDVTRDGRVRQVVLLASGMDARAD